MRDIFQYYPSISLDTIKRAAREKDATVHYDSDDEVETPKININCLLFCAAVDGREDIVGWLMSPENAEKTEMCSAINKIWKQGGVSSPAIYVAAKNGHLSCVKLLVGNGADPAICATDLRESPLKAAVRNGHRPVVDYLIKLIQENGHETLKTNVLGTMNRQNKYHEPNVAFLVAQRGWTTTLEQLDKLRVDLNKECCAGRPLAAAAAAGNVEVVQFLLGNYSRRTEVVSTINDRCPHAYSTALLKSASGKTPRHFECLKALIAAGASLELADRENITPLMAALNHSLDAARFILAQSGIQRSQLVNTLNNRDKQQRSALHLAAEKGAADIVQQLVEEPLSVDSPDLEGQTPLFLAVKSKNLATVKSIINARNHLSQSPEIGNINQRAITGYTAAMQAVVDNQLPILKLLVEAGADLTIPDNFGTTPLLMAVRKKHYELITFLLQQKKVVEQINLQFTSNDMITIAHESVTDPQIRTALSSIEEKESPEKKALTVASCKKARITQKVNYGLQDADGFTPLMRAAQQGDIDAIKFLLRQPTAVIMVDAQSKNEGLTAAHLIILHNSDAVKLDCLTQLAAAGANLGITDFSEKTPLWYAAEKGFDLVVHFLLTDSVAKSSVIATANNEIRGENIVYSLIYQMSSKEKTVNEGCFRVMAVLVTIPEMIIERPCYDDATPVWQAVNHSNNRKFLEQLLRTDIPRADKVRNTLNSRWSQDGTTAVNKAVKIIRSCSELPEDFANFIFYISSLITAGADLSIADHHSETPLLRSLRGPNEVTELLLNADKRGNTTLRQTINAPQQLDTEFLHMTAFYIAVKREHFDWAVSMLEQGAQLSYPGAEKLLSTSLKSRAKETSKDKQIKLDQMIALLLLGCTVPLEQDLDAIYEFKRPITTQIKVLVDVAVETTEEKRGPNLLLRQELQCRKFFQLMEVSVDPASADLKQEMESHQSLRGRFHKGWFFGMGANLRDPRACVTVLQQCDGLLKTRLTEQKDEVFRPVAPSEQEREMGEMRAPRESVVVAQH